MHIHDAAEQYLDRPAEMLVLQGYRHWTLGFATKDVRLWDEAWNLYCLKLGSQNARDCVNKLITFVKALGNCASCPLKTLPLDDRALCRDECLIIGLIAAMQHTDEIAAEVCLQALTCKSRCDEVAFAARDFAFALQRAQSVLHPVPATILMDIAHDDMPSRQVH